MAGYRPISIEDLPTHLVLEILCSGRLSAVDLLHLESTSRTFGGSGGLYPHKFRSLVDYAAFQLCISHSVYAKMEENAQTVLSERCGGKWKRILRFLQSVEQSSDMVETSAGNMHITTGRYHTLLISNSSVYSCGSSLCGVLGQGPETKLCVTFTRISFPSPAHVVQVSASHNHAAFVMQSGEVYTWGKGYCGALGHGDEIDKTTPELLSRVQSQLAVQVCARKRKTFVLMDNGLVYGCGWMGFGSLGFTDRGLSDKILSPRILDSLRPHHVSQISTGLYHTVAITNSGQLFGFGDNERAQLGHDTLRACLKPTEIFIAEMTDEVNLVSENL